MACHRARRTGWKALFFQHPRGCRCGAHVVRGNAPRSATTSIFRVRDRSTKFLSSWAKATGTRKTVDVTRTVHLRFPIARTVNIARRTLLLGANRWPMHPGTTIGRAPHPRYADPVQAPAHWRSVRSVPQVDRRLDPPKGVLATWSPDNVLTSEVNFFVSAIS